MTMMPSIFNLSANSLRRSSSAPSRRFRRAEHDFYPTPPEATRALLSVETFNGSIWEPACGDGAIASILKDDDYHVVATDLIDRGFGIGGIDFLKEDRPRARNIITNPPYGSGLADAFVEHALNLTAMTGGSVAMLLIMTSLCSPKRHSFWVTRPPSVIYGIDELVCFPNGRYSEAFKRACYLPFCWAVWHPEPISRPAFWWLSMDEFRKPQSPRATAHAQERIAA